MPSEAVDMKLLLMKSTRVSFPAHGGSAATGSRLSCHGSAGSLLFLENHSRE
jgi:hypothetical protein